jgi:hypothetical protein
MLNPERVRIIRTAGLTDTYFAREYRVAVRTVRDARVGTTWKNHPTPPDTAPREGGMPYWQIKAKPARPRRNYFHE